MKGEWLSRRDRRDDAPVALVKRGKNVVKRILATPTVLIEHEPESRPRENITLSFLWKDALVEKSAVQLCRTTRHLVWELFVGRQRMQFPCHVLDVSFLLGHLKPRLCSCPRPHPDPHRFPAEVPLIIMLQSANSLPIHDCCAKGWCCLSGCRRGSEDKECERLIKCGLAVGGREHGEEL